MRATNERTDIWDSGTLYTIFSCVFAATIIRTRVNESLSSYSLSINCTNQFKL